MRNRMGRIGFRRRSSCRERKGPLFTETGPGISAGGIVTGAGSLGMVTMGILSAVFPVVVSEAPAGWSGSSSTPAWLVF